MVGRNGAPRSSSPSVARPQTLWNERQDVSLPRGRGREAIFEGCRITLAGSLRGRRMAEPGPQAVAAAAARA